MTASPPFVTPHRTRRLGDDATAPRPDAAAKLSGNPGYLTDRIAPGRCAAPSSAAPTRMRASCGSTPAPPARCPACMPWSRMPTFPAWPTTACARSTGLVLCRDKVRYVGDLVAAVAAVDMATARAALALIAVDYSPPPLVDDAEAALAPQCPEAAHVHPGGNLLHRVTHRRGDLAAAKVASVQYRRGHRAPRRADARVPGDRGRRPSLMARARPAALLRRPQPGTRAAGHRGHARPAAQPGQRDRHARGRPHGGKDELTVQPIAALLAWKTQRAVRLHRRGRNRWISGVKRHPMRIRMRTGCDAQGRLTFQQVDILADTGAYATHGPEVLDAAVEHAPGPYRHAAVAIHGRLAYTNNGVAGGQFRGSARVQVQYALEQQIDRLAARAGLDAARFRAINLAAPDAPGPLGQQVVPFDGLHRALDVARAQPLWRGPHRWHSGDGRFVHGAGWRWSIAATASARAARRCKPHGTRAGRRRRHRAALRLHRTGPEPRRHHPCLCMTHLGCGRTMCARCSAIPPAHRTRARWRLRAPPRWFGAR